MIHTEVRSAEAWWTETGAEEWSDAIVAAMKLGGVDNLFFVSGSELTFYQEATAKAHAKGWPAPRLVTMTHEHVALNAALGNAMVRNQPAATAVHVDVGTLHYGLFHRPPSTRKFNSRAKVAYGQCQGASGSGSLSHRAVWRRAQSASRGDASPGPIFPGVWYCVPLAGGPGQVAGGPGQGAVGG